MDKIHKKIWNNFCSKHNISEQGIELFETSNDLTVSTKTIGRKYERPILKRNEDLDNRFRDLCSEIEKNPQKYDGILYLMYTMPNNHITPLYVGKTETYGKSGNISSLIKGSNIPRWDDGEYYHIGGLSSVVMKNFPEDKKRPAYQSWAKRLFKDIPTNTPVLKEKVYLWIGKWETGQKGIWQEFGATPLPMQESMLIGLCHQINNDLLNTEGLTRTFSRN